MSKDLREIVLSIIALIILMALAQSCTNGEVTSVGNVEGIVTSADTGLPIKDMTVKIGETYDTTSAEGVYTLSNIEVGERTILASGDNFKTYSGNVTVERDTTITFNIQATPGSDEEPDGQIAITYPAKSAVIKESTVLVKADIPSSSSVNEVVLLVDGMEIAVDNDGSPWEIPWPSYYWADGNMHTLLLKAVTASGNELRSNAEYHVQVDPQANSCLMFSEGLDGLKIKDTDSLTVGFMAFPGATHYELSCTGRSAIVTDSTSVDISGLNVGVFDFRYMAIIELPDQSIITGPWSNPISIEVLPPDLPSINEPEITKSDSDSSYDVYLTWENLGEGDMYTITITDLTGLNTLMTEITDKDHILIHLELGEYYFKLQRRNSLGQESILSEKIKLGVGIFKKYFGGSDDEKPKKFIRSSEGGYIILAWSKSAEISDTIDTTNGDDWIFKVNEQGDMVWQYISYADGASRFFDIIELSNGSIVSVGTDYESNKAVILTLGHNGNFLMENVYSPDEISERYAFTHIIQIKDKIYISGAIEEYNSCNECIPVDRFFLHTLSFANGSISDPFNLPVMDGLTRLDISGLEQTSDNLVVAGYACTEGVVYKDVYTVEGAYIQVLDDNFNVLETWNNAGGDSPISIRTVGSINTLSNGNVVLIGSSSNGYTALSIVSDSCVFLSDYMSYNYYYGVINSDE